MIFNISNPAPSNEQIESYRVGLLAKRHSRVKLRTRLLNIYLGLLILALFIISYRHSFNFLGIFTDPAVTKQLFAPFIFQMTLSYFTVKYTNNAIFYIDSHLSDLQVLSPGENHLEYYKLKSMSHSSKPVADYLQTISDIGRYPVRAELYAAEDFSV